MNLEWIVEDGENTLGRATKFEIEGIKNISPLHALTKREIEIAERYNRTKDLGNNNLIVAGESLAYPTFSGVGDNSSIRDALFERMKQKMVKGKVNLIHTRIPHQYDTNGRIIDINKVSELQASGLVGIQLEADASAIIPPLNSGLSSITAFNTVYERTKTEIETMNKEKDIIGYIPRTSSLGLIPDMVKNYIKDGIRFFAVDFSSSPLDRWLIRTVAVAIRTNLKIKGRIGENSDKYYYLHLFNVSPNRKSELPVSPITDILTHAYGVDSTSGVVWGGGKIVKEKIRYYNMQDYGAYRIGCLDENNINYDKRLIEGSAISVYEKLRTERIVGYKKECELISQTMGENKISGYAPYLLSKVRAKKDVNTALIDIKEIRANSKT